MLYGDDLRDKRCNSCKQLLLKDGLLQVAYEDGYWWHRQCLGNAQRQLSHAMFLAKLYALNQAIGEYAEQREVL